MVAAKDWIAETNGEPGEHNTGINIYAWANDHPDAAFGVIQTIFKLTEGDDRLFAFASAGPLETLASLCSDDFIAFVFEVAQVDPRLRSASEYVWQSGSPIRHFTHDRYQKVKRFATSSGRMATQNQRAVSIREGF